MGIDQLVTGGDVDDPVVDSLNTEDATINRYTTVEGDTLQDILDAMQSFSRVRLEPDKTYSGSSTIDYNGQDHGDVIVWAEGATIEYTGSDTILDIHQTDADNYDGEVDWHYGTLKGQGPSSTTNAVRITDSFGHDIKPSVIQDVKYGVHIRNVDTWCENPTVHIRNSTTNIEQVIRCVGPSVTGGSGTPSGVNAEFKLPFGTAKPNDVSEGAAIWQEDYNIDNGHVIIEGFTAPSSGYGWYMNGDCAGTVAEIGTQSNGGTVLEILTDRPPVFLYTVNRGSGTLANKTSSGNALDYGPDGITDLGVGELVEFATGASSSKAVTWQGPSNLDIATGGQPQITHRYYVNGSERFATYVGNDNNYLVRLKQSGAVYRVEQESDGGLADIAGGGRIADQRGAPSTGELSDGERMIYVSDGTDSHSAGDLVSARNNGGTIVDQVVAAASGDS